MESGGWLAGVAGAAELDWYFTTEFVIRDHRSSLALQKKRPVSRAPSFLRNPRQKRKAGPKVTYKQTQRYLQTSP
jgi:hypothetical protein